MRILVLAILALSLSSCSHLQNMVADTPEGKDCMRQNDAYRARCMEDCESHAFRVGRRHCRNACNDDADKQIARCPGVHPVAD
jgi:hypothetical protein